MTTDNGPNLAAIAAFLILLGVSLAVIGTVKGPPPAPTPPACRCQDCGVGGQGARP